jgi:hypothetical protein
MARVTGILFLLVFALALAVIWWVITRVFVVELSGWPVLEQRFPETHDTLWLTLRGRSGQMGKHVYLSGLLTLAAGPAGLRIKIMGLFAPGREPITVPWNQISAKATTLYLLPTTRLSFGTPEVGTLAIDTRLWLRLSERAPLTERLPPVTAAKMGQALLLLWVALTLFAGTFLLIGGGLSPASAYGIPGTFCGFALLLLFARP